MRESTRMSDYHKELQEALDNQFLRETLDKFAVAYRANRQTIFADVNEKELIADIARSKDIALSRMDELFEQFKAEAQKQGVHVHLARDGQEANELIASIANDNNCKTIIKSKSMTSEETLLNHHLEEQGFVVDETDLGEWIIQLREEPPTHMVMPAIHLSRNQVADVFSEATGQQQDNDISKLVKVARRELRAKFIEADMGISGANFAIADTGTIGICTNEGNGRLVTTLPRVHVALCGLDKLVPSLDDALKVISVLPRNATAQAITAYVSWMTGSNECLINDDKRKIMHIVFLDNGRRALAKDPVCKNVLRCVRCGACANVCPVYRLVGGHKMGYIYIGAIGLILTYFFHGKDKAKNLVQNCINCEACKNVCAADIDLPGIIQELRSRLNEENGSPLESSLLSMVMKDRKMFHRLLRFGRWAQLPFTTGSSYMRHLPHIFMMKGQDFRSFPALAATPFRDTWEDKYKHAPATPESKLKVGLFAGCAQDFMFPEQLEAGVKVLQAKGCSVEFPEEQTCCGLPLQMMGERKTAISVAEQNIKAFTEGFDYIVTLCPSCASHLKHGYKRLLQDSGAQTQAAEEFSKRIIDFNSFIHDVLGVGSEDLNKSGEKVCYHAPCHECRAMNAVEQPRALMGAAAEYIPTEEEDVCCGFGGTYSLKFPEVSSQLMDHKLSRLEQSGAQTLITSCPGCILQLRGGEERRGQKLKVEHMAELLARNLKSEK